MAGIYVPQVVRGWCNPLATATAQRNLLGRRYQDERLMRRRDGELMWCRVTGQATDAEVPAREAVWAFERVAHEVGAVASLSPREREVVT
jgi:hypothetical protein